MAKVLNRKQARERVVNVTLTCRHTRDQKLMYVPEEGEMYWCFKCHANVFVTGWTDEYRTKCEVCRYARRHGQARLESERVAGKHHRMNPTHEVTVWFGATEHHTWHKAVEEGQQSFTISLPSDSGECPF